MVEESFSVEKTDGLNTHDIKVLSKKQFEKGGVEKKFRIEGEISRGEKTKAVSLVERDFGERNKDYLGKWKKLKEVGLPVVSTMRLTDQNKIVMTDLKADGSELYGKGIVFEIALAKYANKTPRESSNIDKIFLEIMDNEEEVELIKEKTNEYAKIATENGISLAVDDPFELVVHPNGEWDLVCLDLELLQLKGGTDKKNTFAKDVFINSIYKAKGALLDNFTE